MKNKGCMQRWFLKWIAAMLMVMLLTQLGAVLPLPGSGLQKVHAAAKVSSWTELTAAVATGGTQVITLDSNFAYDGTSIVIPSGADITIKGSQTIFSSDQSSYDSMFKVEKDGMLTIDSGVTLSAKTWDGGQTCPDGSTYTSDKFTGAPSADGKTYEPKGFFIHVEEGGSATLNGTVSDFVTSRNKATTPRYVAPVVANGNGAQFHLGPGGVIKNNVVGYIVDDNQAYQDAQTIKQYVKGAGPNVPRVPNAETQKQDPAKYANRARQKDAKIDGGAAGSGITATAGAVIYKGGAEGTIEGTITNNRGDTGGIMVSGEGTVVTISGAGATLSKNVGVQFGGGSTVEQGGTIDMRAGQMTENAAWFGGGAVYATQNGVDWLLGRMVDANGAPLFDSRVDGVFEMNGGSLNKNTAFTRGGAILADSNGVHITKGNLQENMSRMLGGAVYVMGDHPQYTYTMYLDFVRVHDNTAVSGQYGRPQWGQNYPENQNIEGVPASQELAKKNNLLQTKLKAPSACGGEGDSIFKGTDDLISNNTDDMNDGRATDGTGGGVWLCAYGSTTFDAGDPAKVSIDNNYATGTKGSASKWDSASVKASFEANQKESADSRSGRSGGSDFHSDTGDVGSVTIKNANSELSAWKNENSGESFTESEFTSSEILNLVSTKRAPSASYYVDISGNIARRGGGLAADGTFFLGVVEDRVTADAQMQVAKKWAFTADKSPIAIRVEATDAAGKKAVVADVPLDGTANPPLTEFDTTEELEPTTNSSNGAAIWHGRFNLPLQLDTSDGSKIDVFTFTVKGTYVDGPNTDGVTSSNVTPTTAEGSSNLAKVLTKIRNKHLVAGEPDNAAINDEIKEAITVEYKNGLKFSCKELEVEYDNEVGTYVIKTDGSGNPIEKTNADGSPTNGGKYVLSWANADLSNVSFELNTTVEKATDPDTGSEIDLYSIHMLGMSLVLEAANDNEAITEKYVNKDVHADIIEFDKEFTYDIMAYVPIDATEFTLSDPLVNGLEFADASGNKTTIAQQAIQQIAIHTVNNHETGSTGTVSSPVSENLRIKKDTVNAKIEGNTLSITVDNDSQTSATGVSEKNALKAVQGKWVQLSFNARIKDEYRNLDALKALVSGTTKPSGETKSWEEQDSNKQGNPSRVYSTGNGDLALVAPLIAMVGPDEIIWAVEGPERLFARTASGKYYATPASDNKAGDTWDVCAEGTADWTNADNRYNGRPPQAYNTIGTIDLAEEKLNALKNLPAVKRETVEEACEGPSRLFAKTSGGDYYATPMNDKSGLVWVKLENNSADWKNANNRFNRTGYESRNTIRFFDLDPAHNVLTLDPAKMTNWPVISDEKHEGMANQASYTVKTANRADASYKTNTVTVAPETTELDVEKVWAPENKWPGDVKNVIFNIYSKKGDEEKQVYVGAKPLTVTLTKDESKTRVSGLPKLKGTYYIAREEKITTTSSEGEAVQDASGSMSARLEDDRFRGIAAYKPIRGYAVAEGADEGRLFAITLDGDYWTRGPGEDAEWKKLNKPAADAGETEDVKLYDQADEIFKANGEDVFDLIEIYTATNTTPSAESYVDVEITKNWKNVTMDEIPSPKDFQSFLVLKNGDDEVTDTYKDKLTVTAKGTTYTARWTELPEGAYTVEEKAMPWFETEISDDGKTITNTKKPEEEKPEIEKFVNEAVHKEIDLTEEFTYDIVAYVTEDADHVKITDTLNDMLTFATDASGVAVVDLADEWGKNNHKVTNSIENVKVNEDATVALNRTPIDDAKVEIDGKTLTVTIENKLKPVYDETEEEITSEETEKTIIGYEYDGEEQPVRDLRGHWIRITFQAKIEKDKALEEIAEAYQTINADEEEKDRAKENVGNAPVVSAEDHRGIPNKAGYTIGVANEAGIQYDRYKDESNTVTVKPKEESVDIAVAKQWDHGSNKDLPASVTIRLLADETEIASMTLDETNQWKGSFAGLAKYKDPETRKNRITYTITEDPVEGYTTAVTGTAEDGFVVTNTFVEEEPGDSEGEGQFTVEKIVGEGVSGTRAYEIRVTMTTESGEVSSETVRLRPGDEPCLFEHIKSGTNVAIEEITTGFKTTYTVNDEETQEFTIQTGDDVRVVVLNEKQEVKPSDEPDKSKKKATPTATPQKKKANATAAPQRGKAAKTGDESNVILWISLMAAAVLALAGVLRKAGK